MTDLPDETELASILAEQPVDEMPAEERAELLALIDRGLDAHRRGEPGIPAERVLQALGG